MEPELKRLLEENLKISKENNKLLIKVRSVQRWAQIARVLYWFIIILVALGAFYYIQPILGNLLNVYTGGVSGIDNIGDITNKFKDQQQIQDFLKGL